MAWYIINVLSGHENKIEAKLRTLMNDKDMEISNYLTDVKVPVVSVTKTKVTVNKSGERKETRVQVEKKLMPSYVLIEVDLNSTNWRLIYDSIKRINGVIGFLGSTLKTDMPTPVSKDEMENILQQTGELRRDSALKYKQDFEIGERVKIIAGPFAEFTGEIDEVVPEKAKLKVSVGIFGRATPVDVDYSQVEKI